MKIHEHQAKDIFKKYEINVLNYFVCFNSNEIDIALNKTKIPLVVKAQIHAGGRGKAGGVKVFSNKDDARKYANSLLGKTLFTEQTGAEGQKVSRVLIEEGCDIKNELYVGLVVDREKSRICLMASTEGGVEIEKVAVDSPEKIFKEWIDPSLGLMVFQANNIANKLSFSQNVRKKISKIFLNLYTAFIDIDASLIEVNPLVITKADDVVALDAKINLDDNALYRQKNIFLNMRDKTQEDSKEILAQQYDLNYIALDGNIGCMVNGAGLAMATMDAIKQAGGEPANFLDVGGSATSEKVKEALKIILQDNKVKAVLINVFGGIVKCDMIAEGVISAVRDLKLEMPLVVRLEGTKVAQGKEILNNSGLSIVPADNLSDGAKKAVNLAKGGTL